MSYIIKIFWHFCHYFNVLFIISYLIFLINPNFKHFTTAIEKLKPNLHTRTRMALPHQQRLYLAALSIIIWNESVHISKPIKAIPCQEHLQYLCTVSGWQLAAKQTLCIYNQYFLGVRQHHYCTPFQYCSLIICLMKWMHTF